MPKIYNAGEGYWWVNGRFLVQERQHSPGRGEYVFSEPSSGRARLIYVDFESEGKGKSRINRAILGDEHYVEPFVLTLDRETKNWLHLSEDGTFGACTCNAKVPPGGCVHSLTAAVANRAAFIRKITVAKEVIAQVAEMDADRALERNGVGFSRNDGDWGHYLASLIASGERIEGQDLYRMLSLATKYARQVSEMHRAVLVA